MNQDTQFLVFVLILAVPLLIGAMSMLFGSG